MSGSKSNNKDDTFKKQGSFRRMFSSNSKEDAQLQAVAKVIERPIIAQNNKEYAIFLQEYNILSEYNMLCNQDLKGVYVIPSAQNSHLWFGVQFVRQGIYQGGVFRFTISLTPNFPEGDCPKIVFQSNVFHPLINSETGELCTSWGFPDWKKTNRIWQLVQYITKIFTKVDTKMTPVNQEAFNLLDNNPESFRERAKSSVRESLNQIYNSPSTDDLHFITFTQYNNKLHDPVKQEIYEQKGLENSKPSGFSWVQPGSLQPFSKLDSR